MTYNIALFIGSLRKDSYNRKIAQALIKMAPADFSFNEMPVGKLPLYNQDDDKNQCEDVNKMKQDILSSNGVLFVTAEYNRSVPGVLKNAIDHASRPYGQNSFAKKPAGVIGVSPGSAGTAMAQQHLRNILAYLDMATMGQPEAFVHATEDMFGENGKLSERSQKFLQNYMDKFVAWVKKASN